MACCKPADYGIEHTNWTRETLAHVSKSLGIVDQISGRYVGKIIKKRYKAAQESVLVISQNTLLEFLQKRVEMICSLILFI